MLLFCEGKQIAFFRPNAQFLWPERVLVIATWVHRQSVQIIRNFIEQKPSQLFSCSCRQLNLNSQVTLLCYYKRSLAIVRRNVCLLRNAQCHLVKVSVNSIASQFLRPERAGHVANARKSLSSCSKCNQQFWTARLLPMRQLNWEFCSFFFPVQPTIHCVCWFPLLFLVIESVTKREATDYAAINVAEHDALNKHA